MHIVRGHYLGPYLAGNLNQKRQVADFLLDTVVLDLDVEVLAEHPLQLQGKFLGAVIIPCGKPARYAARKACGQAYEAFGVLREDLVIYFRLVIEAVHKGNGVQLHQIPVPSLVLGEENQVLSCGILDSNVLRHVELAPDYVLDARLGALLREVQRAVHVAVVRNGHGIYAVLFAVVH